MSGDDSAGPENFELNTNGRLTWNLQPLWYQAEVKILLGEKEQKDIARNLIADGPSDAIIGFLFTQLSRIVSMNAQDS